MIYVNEREVKCSTSQVLQAFKGISTLKEFLDMGLPIKKFTKPGNVSSTKPEDLADIYNKLKGLKKVEPGQIDSSGSADLLNHGNIVMEIDLG